MCSICSRDETQSGGLHGVIGHARFDWFRFMNFFTCVLFVLSSAVEFELIKVKEAANKIKVSKKYWIYNHSMKKYKYKMLTQENIH